MIHNPIQIFKQTQKRFLSKQLDQEQYKLALKYLLENEQIYEYSEARELCIKEFIDKEFNMRKSDFLFFENLLLSDTNFLIRFNALFILLKHFPEKSKEPIHFVLEKEDGFLNRLSQQLGIRNSKELSRIINNPVIKIFLHFSKIYNRKKPSYNENPDIFYMYSPETLTNVSGNIVITSKNNKDELKFKKSYTYSEFKKLKEEKIPAIVWYYQDIYGIRVYEYKRLDNVFRYYLLKENLYPHLNNIIKLFGEDYNTIKINIYTHKTNPAIFFHFPKSKVKLGINCLKIKFWNQMRECKRIDY